jgi:hypothetical protein
MPTTLPSLFCTVIYLSLVDLEDPQSQDLAILGLYCRLPMQSPVWELVGKHVNLFLSIRLILMF